MVRLADGDRSAFSPLYTLLWPALRVFVHRQLPASDAEDVAQDALLKVFARASRFDPARDALAWALGIAAFEVRTARKRTARRKEELLEPLGLPDPHLLEGIRSSSTVGTAGDRCAICSGCHESHGKNGRSGSSGG